MFTEVKQQFWQIVHAATSASKATYAAIVVALLVAILYFRLIYRRPGNFDEELDNMSKIPILDRDYDPIDETWGRMKLLIWVLLSVGSGMAAYHQLPRWFPELFR